MEEMMKKRVWAVVGANTDPEKYGYKIYKQMKENGYTTYAVNPNYEDIEGDKCYPNLSALPEVPEVIDMVVSPKRGMAVVEEAAKLGIKNICLQPGTVSDELLELAQRSGIRTVQACVLVALITMRASGNK